MTLWQTKTNLDLLRRFLHRLNRLNILHLGIDRLSLRDYWVLIRWSILMTLIKMLNTLRSWLSINLKRSLRDLLDRLFSYDELRVKLSWLISRRITKEWNRDLH
jgi:hypothetical protein